MSSQTPAWMEEEQGRAATQAATGRTVNSKAKTAPKVKPIKRSTKGFQVDDERAAKWDQLVAQMKNDKANKRTGPQLHDEALDYIFEKYLKT
ncbi:MAG: hypothetical protein AAF066_16340 [Pseudomonadota bacterium]